jgi:Ca2+-transporting ATPase
MDSNLPLNVGLTAAEAARRLEVDGPNQLPGGERRSLLAIATHTLREPMFLLLLAAATLYLVFGEWREGLTLVGFVLVTLALTLFQEGRTERAVDALRELSSPLARVLRDGALQPLPAQEVVRGDVLQLREGDRVPADALLLSADKLHADESLLTGESLAMAKRVARADEFDAPLAPAGGDDLPGVYAGTLVIQGHALAQVVATGARSAIGRIGTALGQVADEPSPLQKQTARLVRTLALLALTLSLALVLAHGLIGGDWLQALLAGIALAMALLPEEYPLVLTLFPALGARRLAGEGVLTRRINAIETLGATTVLCSDKTGTLTENRMSVSRLVAGGTALSEDLDLGTLAGAELPEAFHTLVEFSILASVADPYDPMEKAFHRLGTQFLSGSEHLHRDWRLVQTYALSPALRAMSHVWAHGGAGEQTVAAKGAPEAVAELCHLDAGASEAIARKADALAAEGLRVLAVARGRFEGTEWPAEEHDFQFDFVGLLGLSDPVRAAVPPAVAECHAAGLRVIMITGDHPATALAIARQAGLHSVPADMLSGDELGALGDEALRERMRRVSVCARISPEQKLRIVMALKAGGEVVAMTGDGVNDAPALRAARVGIAMGARGTDVAREAASLVLVDDDFAAIVRALRLGRRIFDNLRKAMSYVLAVHVPIAGMAMLPVLFGWPPLLYPMHIALLELIIDPACSLAFENEPPEPDLMQRPPRDATAPLFGPAALGLALVQGLGVLAVVVAAFSWAHDRLPDTEARAFAFATLVVANLALIVSNRSATRGLWLTLRTPNRTLWAVIGLAAALLLAALYVPWAMEVLRFAPLPLHELAAACGLGLLSVLWFEGVKAWRTRSALRPLPAIP